jgi:hypothetical protein
VKKKKIWQFFVNLQALEADRSEAIEAFDYSNKDKGWINGK